MANFVIKCNTARPGTMRPNIMPRAFLRHGIVVRAREGVDAVFAGFSADSLEVASRLHALLTRARGLSLEFGADVNMDPANLTVLLEKGIGVARDLGNEFQALSATRLNANEIMVTAKTFSAEELQNRRLRGIHSVLQALARVGEELSTATSKNAAEAVIAKTLFTLFGVAEVRAYDVSADRLVRLSHAWKTNGGLERVPRENLNSHFSEWAEPRPGEAMREITDGKSERVFIEKPEEDMRCVAETMPTVLLAEKIGGRTTRVYKVDWEKAWDHRVYAQIVGVLFDRLAEAKARIVNEKMEAFFREIQTMIMVEKNLEKILENISTKMAEFFRINGNRELPQRVSIMLHDVDADSLVTRVIYDKDAGVQYVSFFNGSGHKGIGRRIFDADRGHILGKATDWSGSPVEWMRDGRGSLMASVVKSPARKLGVILISSDRENAFSSEQKVILERLAQNIAPAFERIIEHLDQLKLHESHADLAGKNPHLRDKKLYNLTYLKERLKADLIELREKGKPISLLYIDIDHFKALNEVWGVHTEVDFVLAEIFARIISKLRDGGELYRVGGEEMAVRVPGDITSARHVAQRILLFGRQPMDVFVPYDDPERANKRFNELRQAIMITREIKEAKKLPAEASAQALTALKGKYAKLKEINARRPSALKERDPLELFEKVFAHPDHGILAVELLPGREGTKVVKVTVEKRLTLGGAAATPEDSEESLRRTADGLEAQAKRHGRDQIAIEDDDTVRFLNLPEGLDDEPEEKPQA